MKLIAPTHHVFVDFENVHAVDLAIFASETFEFSLFLGPKQKQLKIELVAELLKHASSVRLIRLESSGKNALDFALAYYVGQAVASDPNGSFHFISKDRGFDPLIEHLRTKQINAQRHDDFSNLDFVPVPDGVEPKVTPTTVTAAPIRRSPVKPPKAGRDRLGALVAHLENNGSNRPGSKVKLVSDVVSYFAREQLSDAEAKGLINQLRQRGLISIDGKGAVTYNIAVRSLNPGPGIS